MTASMKSARNFKLGTLYDLPTDQLVPKDVTAWNTPAINGALTVHSADADDKTCYLVWTSE